MSKQSVKLYHNIYPARCDTKKRISDGWKVVTIYVTTKEEVLVVYEKSRQQSAGSDDIMVSIKSGKEMLPLQCNGIGT